MPQLTAYVWPVKRVKTLETRRKQAGMGTMHQQAAALEEVGGYKMIWNKSLSIKEIKTIAGQK